MENLLHYTYLKSEKLGSMDNPTETALDIIILEYKSKYASKFA